MCLDVPLMIRGCHGRPVFRNLDGEYVVIVHLRRGSIDFGSEMRKLAVM